MKDFRKGNSQREFHQSFRSQSAMEYLMTYGWAILIIAVVLAALFELGVFNPMTFAPKAAPGSCQVVRPEGAGTTNFISLEGECNGELPQYVAQFNGQSSYINLGNSKLLSPEAGSNGKMTICGWVKVLSLNNYHGFLIKGASSPSNGNGWEYTIGQGTSENYIVWTNTGSNIAAYDASLPTANTWWFMCFAYNYASSNSFVFMNGDIYQATFSSGTPATEGTGDLILGAGENGFSNVELANIQIYNTAISANDIQALYQEGIGGAPINIQNLVGWWPLNGNTNDYSGNGNNGVPSGVTYTSNWYSGYSAP
ncbi:MAG: LamG-like jellyroll fold domain-containing protein [Candidatus Micrarchaeaceae archaeon]